MDRYEPATEMDTYENGDYILYEDHKELICQLEEEIEKLKKNLNKILDVVNFDIC